MRNSIRNLEELSTEAFLRLPEVISLVGLSRASIYELIARDRFPAQHKLTEHASGWRVGAIRQWLADPAGWPGSNESVR